MNFANRRCPFCGSGRGTRRYSAQLSEWRIRASGYAHAACVEQERERRARGLYVIKKGDGKE